MSIAIVMSSSEGSGECPTASEPVDLVMFDQLNITKLKVVACNNKSVRFSVQVEVNSCCAWTLGKTYDDFVKLQKSMRRRHIAGPSLRLPKNNCSGKNPKQQAVEQLCTQLEEYLKGLLATGTSPLGQTEPFTALLAFLEYNLHGIDVVRIANDLVTKTKLSPDDKEAIQVSSLQLHCVTRRLASMPSDPEHLQNGSTSCDQLQEFISKLKGIHVVRQDVENLLPSSLNALSLDLSSFKSLTYLKLESIYRPQLRGMECIVHQLLTLAVHQCIQTLSDVLVYYSTPPQDIPAPPQLDSALPWTHLTCANFKKNNLKAIDPSIKLLPALKKLDLSFNQISEIENTSELTHLEVLDLSYNCIKSLQGASSQLGHVKELRLSHNQISCLDGLEKLSSLKSVDLSFNKIASEVELCHLTLLHLLEELHLHDNPICTSKPYRVLVLSEISSKIVKITLDGKEPSLEERKTVNSVRLADYQIHKQGSQPVDIPPVLLGGKDSRNEGGSFYDVIETPKPDEDAEKQSIMWRVEQMRKEGGDRWLENGDIVESIHIPALTPQSDETKDDPKKSKKRRTKKTSRNEKEKVEGEEKESLPEQSVVISCAKEPEVVPVKVFSDKLQQLIEAKQNELTMMPATFPVLLLEYNGPLHHLCPHDMDHLLCRNLEMGVVTITSRWVEETITSGAGEETITAVRARRDLSTLHVLHIHEGKIAAVCMGLQDDSGSSLSWIIYSVPDLPTSASLYVALKQAAKQNEGLPDNHNPNPVSGISSVGNPYVFPTTASVIPMPGLESQELMEYFRCSIAREKNETLLAVEWGVSQLPCCFLCGIETGLFVSDRSLYLMEVIAQPVEQLPWRSKSLPLRLIVQANLEDLCQVTSGTCDQYIILEFSRRISTRCFVMFPYTCDQGASLVHHIVAALDGYSIPHRATTTRKKEITSSKERNEVAFVDEGDGNHLGMREDLVKEDLLVKTVSCGIQLDEFDDINSELDVKQASSKVVIIHYVVGWEVLSDIIPSTPGVCSLQLRALVLTQDRVYLCREDVLSCLVMGSIPMCSSSLLSFVLDSHPMSEVTCIKECDKAYLPLSPSNPVYQFSIAFSHADPNGDCSSGEWVFCVHNCQLMDQFTSSLCKAWCGIHGSPLPHVHTTVPLVNHPLRTSLPSEDSSTQGLKPSIPSEDSPTQVLRFYHSRALLELCMSSYDTKVEFFKEYVPTTTEFDRMGDDIQAFFMGRGRPSYHSYVEIEVCVIVSKTSIILVSTPDGAVLWNDKNASSHSDTAKRQNKTADAMKLQRVHQMWLSDIKEVNVGLFYLSVHLITGNCSEEGVVIITQLPSSTLALLGAISGAVDLKDVVTEEVLLREFDDVSDHPITMSLSTWRPLPQRPSASFRQALDAEGNELLSLLANYTSENIKHPKVKKIQPSSICVLCQQVMAPVDKVNTHATVVAPGHLHLVLLTNHGLYMCSNDSYSNHSPAVFRAQQLSVKKWCPIEQVGHLEVTMAENSIRIYPKVTSTQSDRPKRTSTQSDQPNNTSTQSDQPKHTSPHSDHSSRSHMSPIVHLVAQNSELVRSFIYLLSLLWSENNGGKVLTIKQT